MEHFVLPAVAGELLDSVVGDAAVEVDVAERVALPGREAPGEPGGEDAVVVL